MSSMMPIRAFSLDRARVHPLSQLRGMDAGLRAAARRRQPPPARPMPLRMPRRRHQALRSRRLRQRQHLRLPRRQPLQRCCRAAPAHRPLPRRAPLRLPPRFAPHGAKVHVRTDVLDLDIALQGGTIERADLLRYPKVKGGSEPVRLMNTDPRHAVPAADRPHRARRTPSGPRISTPFTSAQSDYQLGSASRAARAAHLDGRQRRQGHEDVHLPPRQYRIDLEYDVENHSDAPWAGRAVRADPAQRSDDQALALHDDVENYAFHGPASTTARSTASSRSRTTRTATRRST